MFRRCRLIWKHFLHPLIIRSSKHNWIITETSGDILFGIQGQICKDQVCFSAVQKIYNFLYATFGSLKINRRVLGHKAGQNLWQNICTKKTD